MDSNQNRGILHADFDAFYASVEQRDFPELENKPLAVGGNPRKRGVVASASYEARKFGIKSAMPMSIAVRKCPEVVVVPPRFSVYREVSQQVMEMFKNVTPLVEPLSLDEAYLDVTELIQRNVTPPQIAKELKDNIASNFGLTICTKKTKTMILNHGGSKKDYPKNILIIRNSENDQVKIENVPVFKYLGVKLDFRDYKTGLSEINYRINTANNKFRELKHLFCNKKIDLSTRMIFYNSFVRSRLCYLCGLWNLTKKQENKISKA